MRLLAFVLFSILLGGFLPLHSEEPLLRTEEQSIEKLELTLYYTQWCYYCQRVVNYMNRINKTITVKDVQYSVNKEELLKIGGKKQVPCLIIEGKPLYESKDIIDWISSHQELLEDK